MYLDAIGKSCPMPVVMAKKELDKGCTDLTVAVDNKTAVENLKRLAAGRGLSTSEEESGGIFKVRITGEGKGVETEEGTPVISCGCAPSYAVFFGRDSVGDGDHELGYNLAKMAIYTLSQSAEIPTYLLFMNSGVKLVTGEEKQIEDSLNELINKGCEVLVCGTCLNFYGLADKLKVGTVSNMYDIIGGMQSVAKVITL